MTSLVKLALLLLTTVSSSLGFYVENGGRIYYFSDTDIPISVEAYNDACFDISYIGIPASIPDAYEQNFLFRSYSGRDSYLIGRFGPQPDGGHFDNYTYTNFKNESAARSGNFGIAYIDFPRNQWKVAPLMAPQRMRYICRILNLCTISEDPCGRSAQCVFNTSSGVFSCQTNATRCEDGVTCMHQRGVCINQRDGGYMCQCRDYFTGKHCENSMRCKIDNPCQNGGTFITDV